MRSALALPGVAAQLRALPVAAAAAGLLPDVIGRGAAPPASDVALAVTLLAVACCSLHGSSLGRNKDDGVPSQEHLAELSGDLSLRELLGLLQHDVDVDVEGMQDATVGAAVLQLDDDRLVPGMVERVQGTLGFHAPGEPRLLFKALPGSYLLTGLRPTRETHYWHKRCHPRL